MAEVETEIAKLRSLVAEQQRQITVLSSAISLMRNHGPEQLRELFKQQSVGQVQPQPSPTPQQPPPPQQPPALLTVPSGNDASGDASGDARGLMALSPSPQSYSITPIGCRLSHGRRCSHRRRFCVTHGAAGACGPRGRYIDAAPNECCNGCVPGGESRIRTDGTARAGLIVCEATA